MEMTVLLRLLLLVLASALAAAENPLGYWRLDVITAGELAGLAGAPAITAPEGLQVVQDDRRGPVLEFGGEARLALPAALCDRLTDTATVTMWLKPKRPATDAAWQILLETGRIGDWRQGTNVRLRWNRFIVQLSQTKVQDFKKVVLAPGRWSHVVITRDPLGIALWVNGAPIGRVDNPELPADFTAGILVGSGDYGGAIADLRLYDRVLTAAEIAAVIAAETPPDVPGGELPAPNIPDLNLGQVKERTGYTVAELKANFPAIEQWSAQGIAVPVDRVADSFARDRFNPPPAPYVHPRIYFSPEDLPAIREHLQTGHLARVQMESIRGRLLQLSPHREDWENVPYGAAAVAAAYPEYLAAGRRIGRRMGFHGPWLGGWVNELAAGRDPEGLTGHWGEHVGKAKGRQLLMHLLPYEAFRCLIDDDETGGRRVAAALTTICRLFGRHLDLYAGTDDWQRIYQHLSSDSIGLTYDWAYNWMTDAQRAEVRGFIAGVTRNKTFLGLDQLPAYPGNTSNWIIIHMNLLPMVLSIEGEEGYDPMVYQRCLEGMRKWVYVASGPLGAPFEGLTKSTYAPQWLLPLAKRQAPFIGTEWSSNHLRRYGLGVMLPWGTANVFETGISSPRDTAAFKYAHPGDPVIDLIYGNTVRAELEEPMPLWWPNVRTTYAPWWPDLFVKDDPIGVAADGSYDWDARFTAVMADLRAAGEPLTYYSDYRGVMTTRTAWDRDAAFLYFEPRNVPGGHTRDARNEFVFAAAGRLWATRTTSGSEDGSDTHSVILIDGVGMGHQCPQGRTVALTDTPLATFAAGDARWAYSFAAGKDTDTPVTVTPNDSRLEPSPLPWMNQPWSFLPAWHTGAKGADRHGHWRPHNEVAYAYRTVGLVRGDHPYALIVDDYRKDGQLHRWDWLMQVPDDLRILAKVVPAEAQSGVLDLVLGDETERRLLLRVLATAGDAEARAQLTANARIELFEKAGARQTQSFARLVLPLAAVEGRFRILLWPFRDGEALPETTIEATRVTITAGRQRDLFAMVPHDDGRTRLTLSREGAETVELK